MGSMGDSTSPLPSQRYPITFARAESDLFHLYVLSRLDCMQCNLFRGACSSVTPGASLLARLLQVHIAGSKTVLLHACRLSNSFSDVASSPNAPESPSHERSPPGAVSWDSVRSPAVLAPLAQRRVMPPASGVKLSMAQQEPICIGSDPGARTWLFAFSSLSIHCQFALSPLSAC